MADSSQDTVSFALYQYTPSLPAAIIFTVIFGGLSLFHLYRVIQHQTYFFIPFILGLLFETAGYIARIFSHYDPNALGPYIVQTILILIAPPLFAASIYMTLGRLIIRLDAESTSLIPVRWLTTVFVVDDVISFFLQSGGGGYMGAGTQTAMTIGSDIVIAGLVIQLLFFGFFVIMAAIFHIRVSKQHGAGLQVKTGRFSWMDMMWGLYFACALILIRSVYRVVEFVEGNDGFIMHREYLLYIFDGLLMAVTGLAVGVVFPGSVLGGMARGSTGGEELECSEMIERERDSWSGGHRG
ncbi:putative RTA1 domain protein [Aspergillus sclerotiicarbonarius CBS 121057]|uniref:Putative RTA1 domain protein n=1 Tax=Aspergillus sclerotiicarbonarius (strain CBS 121057 / IBT 28362) TaxID=1448318 RepID=A0A319DXA6_ASPSB|nr:putative RTA1 domain protein [Aspergillus sclerotiicarbonarius CBS 121057]